MSDNKNGLSQQDNNRWKISFSQNFETNFKMSQNSRHKGGIQNRRIVFFMSDPELVNIKANANANTAMS